MKKIYYSKKLPDIGKVGTLIKSNFSPIVMLVMFAIGLCAGAVIVASGNYNDNYLLSGTFERTVNCMVATNKSGMLRDGLISSSVFIISTIPWGMSSIGLPIICLIPLLRGIGYGALGTYLITQFSMNGMGLYCLSVVPGAIISVFALICACSTAVSMSKSVYMSINGINKPDRLAVKSYAIRLLIYILISGIGCIVNLITSACFKDLFTLV